MTYTEGVGKFAAEMRAQMRANSHKGGWQEMDTMQCFVRAMNEMGELAQALTGSHPNPTHVKREAADVANFLMMLCIAVEK